MRDVSVDDGVHEGCLVEVDYKVALLVSYELHCRKGHALSEGAVRPSGKGAVVVSKVLVSQVLPGRIMHIGERVRPLVEVGRLPVSYPVDLLAPLGGDMQVLRVGIAQYALE